MEKMIIKPYSFSREGGIKTFILQYEKAPQINNWNDNEKIQFLSIFLEDIANEFLQDLENRGGYNIQLFKYILLVAAKLSKIIIYIK